MLVYSHFSKKSKLNISEDFLGMPPLLSKAAVSKVLILSGLNLKSLTVQKIDFVARQNILKIIGESGIKVAKSCGFVVNEDWK